jgi:excisionase family DNA binding protein
MSDQLLTISEFANALRVKDSCVRRWVGQRKVATVHVGRLLRIPRSEVDRIISQGTTPAVKVRST